MTASGSLQCCGAHEDWMSSLPPPLWDVPLHHLSIPGSHATMTYCPDRKSPLSPTEPRLLHLLGRVAPCITQPILLKWAVTQAVDVCEQLSCGVRHLDLHVGLDPEDGARTLRFMHALYSSVLVEFSAADGQDVLTEVAEWLEGLPVLQGEELPVLSKGGMSCSLGEERLPVLSRGREGLPASPIDPIPSSPRVLSSGGSERADRGGRVAVGTSCFQGEELPVLSRWRNVLFSRGGGTSCFPPTDPIPSSPWVLGGGCSGRADGGGGAAVPPRIPGLTPALHDHLVTCLHIFPDALCPREAIPTLRELWSRGQQVLVSYKDELMLRNHSELWPGLPCWCSNEVKLQVLVRYLDTITCCGRLGGLFVAGTNLSGSLRHTLAHPSASLHAVTEDG